MDDLHRRWRRRQRNRRLAAGATALAIFVATAAALGSRLQLGGDAADRPASSQADLAAILAAEATDGLRFVGARNDDGAMTFLVHGDTLARLDRLPLKEGLGRQFRSDGTRPFVLVDVFALRFASEASAQTAYAFVEGDFRRETEAGPSTEFSAPSLGAESVALRNPGNRRFLGTPTSTYLWRRGDLLLGVVAIGSMPRPELVEIATGMDEKALGGST